MTPCFDSFHQTAPLRFPSQSRKRFLSWFDSRPAGLRGIPACSKLPRCLLSWFQVTPPCRLAGLLLSCSVRRSTTENTVFYHSSVFVRLMCCLVCRAAELWRAWGTENKEGWRYTQRPACPVCRWTAQGLWGLHRELMSNESDFRGWSSAWNMYQDVFQLEPNCLWNPFSHRLMDWFRLSKWNQLHCPKGRRHAHQALAVRNRANTATLINIKLFHLHYFFIMSTNVCFICCIHNPAHLVESWNCSCISILLHLLCLQWEQLMQRWRVLRM